MKILGTIALLGLILAGCGKKAAKKEDAAAAEEEKATPEERRFLAAARPFVAAIAQRKYDDAYALLSSHAKSQMSLNQFAPEDDEAKFAEREKNPVLNVTADKFRELMAKEEEAHGSPRSVRVLSVFSTNADILNRRGKEKLDALDSMFAIGNMPESVPAEIRRASLRGKILTQLSAQELEKAARQEGISVEELQKSADFEPYCTLKVVLVEEGGELRVGYFEFLPPGLMD
ncbi:MAG: hypothetical protein K8T20_10045 [Planctomycetes bacterium]|nr:hypothetical protein [Planctomycetota bacterium]